MSRIIVRSKTFQTTLVYIYTKLRRTIDTRISIIPPIIYSYDYIDRVFIA